MTFEPVPKPRPPPRARFVFFAVARREPYSRSGASLFPRRLKSRRTRPRDYLATLCDKMHRGPSLSPAFDDELRQGHGAKEAAPNHMISDLYDLMLHDIRSIRCDIGSDPIRSDIMLYQIDRVRSNIM